MLVHGCGPGLIGAPSPSVDSPDSFLLELAAADHVAASVTVTNTHHLDLTALPAIQGLGITAEVELPQDVSLARVVLVDQAGVQHLVAELFPLVTNDRIISLTGHCEETCTIPEVVPANLRIEVVESTVHLRDIHFVPSTSSQATNADAIRDQSQRKATQDAHRISRLNENLQALGLKWVAGETPVSRLLFDHKRRMFPIHEDSIDRGILNLQGFEYYVGGIFSTVERQNSRDASQEISDASLLPDRWDWRDVHGQDWMTPVRDQGSAGTCWAHSFLGSMEALINLSLNRHLDIDLSEQMLVDCSQGFDPFGPPPEFIRGLHAAECTAPSCEETDTLLCKLREVGVADESCDPYEAREPQQLTQCTYENICQNWPDRMWKVHDYGGFEPIGLSCSGMPEKTKTEIKRALITSGPQYAGGFIWNHAMVLTGYCESCSVCAARDPMGQCMSATGSFWILKNSWGTDHGNKGYTYIDMDTIDLTQVDIMFPIGPVIPPDDVSLEVLCVDDDRDTYCNWGISPEKPSTCPASCRAQRDCDDSDPGLGPFDENFRCVRTTSARVVGTWPSGIWSYDPHTNKWAKMTGLETQGDIAAGDFTGDGTADVASCWNNGLWYQDGASLAWTKVSQTAPLHLAAGDVTGDGRFEIIGTWRNGIWYLDVAVSQWTQMWLNTPAGDIAAGDFTGDGKVDVASIWDSGLWYQDGGNLEWSKVSDTAPFHVTAGDMTGDGHDEVIGNWPDGIRYWDSSAETWTTMYSASADVPITDGDVAAGDFTGDDIDDVATCWGDDGLWIQDGTSLEWTKVSNTAPHHVTAGNVVEGVLDEGP
ncbi:C1 family peptidase [Myxococcota bacterium]